MPAVDQGAGAPAGGGASEGFFQRKVFGIKTWALMLGLTIVVLVWAVIKARQNSNSNSTSSTTTGTNSGTNAQYTPPYVIQTDVNEAPVNVTDNTPVTVNNPAPTPAPQPPPRRRPGPIPGPHPPVPVSPPPSKPPSSGAPVQTKPKPSPGYTVYRVKPGDNLTTIARDFKVFQTSPNPGLALYNYQLTPGLRSAQDDQTLKQRGANKIFANEEIYIPKS